MKLLLIRHAVALARTTPGLLDAERPVTPAGKTKFRIAVRGLTRIVDRIDVLLTSPHVCARESAEIVAHAFGNGEPRVQALLAGDRIDALVATLAMHPREATVALVGHEPTLAALLAHMLGSSGADPFTFKHGGVALVDLPDGPSASGRLVWFIPPRILRGLASAIGVGRTTPTDNGRIVRRKPS